MSKPSNWDNLSNERKKEIADQFFRTTRGQLMIGKALYIASNALKEKQYPEESDAEDMEIFGETIFSMGYGIEVAMEEFKATQKER